MKRRHALVCGVSSAVAATGYTNVENYLNELAGDPIPWFQQVLVAGRIFVREICGARSDASHHVGGEGRARAAVVGQRWYCETPPHDIPI